MERPQAPPLNSWEAIYWATDTDVARRALEDFDAGVWGRKYPAIAQSWRRNWEHVILVSRLFLSLCGMHHLHHERHRILEFTNCGAPCEREAIFQPMRLRP